VRRARRGAATFKCVSIQQQKLTAVGSICYSIHVRIANDVLPSTTQLASSMCGDEGRRIDQMMPHNKIKEEQFFLLKQHQIKQKEMLKKSSILLYIIAVDNFKNNKSSSSIDQQPI
jgi:hypothetical protein